MTIISVALTCASCKHSRLGWSFNGYKCHHPEVGPRPAEIDVVSGKTTKAGWNWCVFNRMHSNDGCGFIGRYWEAK